MRTPTALLAITSVFALASTSPAEETQSLPIYTTEAEAARALETTLEKAVLKAGVTLDSSRPMAPLTEESLVAIGLQANCNGSLEQVIALLTELVDQPFSTCPAVTIFQDRKDPAMTRVVIQKLQWHATGDEAASKIKKWKRIAKPSPSPLELFQTCAAALPEKGGSITSFSADKGTVMVIGQASDPRAGYLYGAKLNEHAESLPNYRFWWIQRPVVDARKKDGSAKFRIQLIPEGER